MNPDITQWVQKWSIPPRAFYELKKILDPEEIKSTTFQCRKKTPEAEVQQQVRLEASRRGARLFRNNSGATYSEDGRLIRYGLGNESKQISSVVKSGDLIGVTPRLILQRHVGQTMGLFTSYEIKKSNWKYSGKKTEVAQRTWNTLINSLGGIAKFITGIEDIERS